MIVAENLDSLDLNKWLVPCTGCFFMNHSLLDEKTRPLLCEHILACAQIHDCLIRRLWLQLAIK